MMDVPRILRQVISTTRRAFIPRRPGQEHVVWAIRTFVALAVVVGILTLLIHFELVTSENAAVIGALIALTGVVITQVVNTRIAQSNQLKQQEVEDRRARAAALQAYLEQMGELLTDKGLREAKQGDNSSTVARAQTLAVLEGLDPDRKGILLQFLKESHLINKDEGTVSLAGANLSQSQLDGAKLNKADLQYAHLTEAKLQKADLYRADLYRANLSGANLSLTDLNEAMLMQAKLFEAFLCRANLRRADLQAADLRGADLSEAGLSGAGTRRGADLSRVKLHYADLRGANLSGANLRGAYLGGMAGLTALTPMTGPMPGLGRGADLREADLSGANLRGADLSEADLRGAKKLTQEQINEAHGDKNTDLPDHLQRPEHWSKGAEESEES